MKDEVWSNYESSSESITGATNMRHDPLLLDKMIQAFQLTPNDLKVSAKRNKVHSACLVLRNIIKNGKVSDSSQDIIKTSSLPTLLINQLKAVSKTQ